MDLLRLLPRLRSAILGVLIVPMAACLAQAQGATEYLVKGAFLYKFGEFVDWPADALPGPGGAFVIGVLGQDPFGASLDQIVQGRTVHGRPVVVRRLARVEQAQGVHVLYISRSESDRWEHDISALRGASVLTVADRDRGAGSVITFHVQENKVRFEIDAAAADRAGLKLSSKLLSLATTVRRTD
ncbi:MAG TPA: YfiR family protein [Holophagaceae bacterium]|nr:YfiR family protein [Holophagaceae bacterium]